MLLNIKIKTIIITIDWLEGIKASVCTLQSKKHKNLSHHEWTPWWKFEDGWLIILIRHKVWNKNQVYHWNERMSSLNFIFSLFMQKYNSSISSTQSIILINTLHHNTKMLLISINKGSSNSILPHNSSSSSTSSGTL